ncbi:MAG: hypothetical protein JSW39_15270, partial [Desulfobacterales bacterium]
GETLFRARQYKEAEAFFAHYIQAYGWEENIARALARTYEALELKAQARDLYGEIMKGCRGCGRRIDPFVKQRYADTSLETGRYTTNVLELYLALAQEDPDNRADYYAKISRIYARQGNQNEARRYQSFAAKFDAK